MSFKKFKDLFSGKKKTNLPHLPIPDDLEDARGKYDAEAVRDLERQGKDAETAGFEQFNGGQYQEAIKVWTEGLITFHKIGKTSSMACMYTNIGTAYRFLGKMDTALQYYEKALELDQKAKDTQGIIEGMLNMGSTYRYLGNIDGALQHFQKGYQAAKSMNDFLMMGLFLENTGYCLLEQAKYDNAIDSFHQLLKIAGEVKELGIHADGLRGLAEVYSSLGEYDTLLEILGELEDILTKTEAQDLRWRILFSLANAYTLLGFRQNAEDTLKTLSDDRTHDLPPAYVSSYSLVIGNYHLVFGDFNTGIDFINNAIEICEKEWNRKKMATACNLMAQFLLHSEQYEKGVQFAKKSLKISKECSDRYMETLNLIILSNLSRHLNQINELARYSSDALSKSVPLARPELTWQAHYCMGLAFHMKEDKKKAFRQYYNAIRLLDEITSKIPREPLQREYVTVPHRSLLFQDFAGLVKSSDKKSDIDNVLKELRSGPIYETLTGHLSG